MPVAFWRRFGFGHVYHLPLSEMPLCGGGSYFKGGAVGDAVQPVGDPLPRFDGRCFPGENQKGGLEGVLGVVVIAKEPEADAQDYGAMTSDEDFKGRFVLPPYKGLQQLPIRPPRPILRQYDPAQMLDDAVDLSGCQRSPSLAVKPGFCLILPGDGDLYTLFSSGPARPTDGRRNITLTNPS
jgi:hypothetical protein